MKLISRSPLPAEMRRRKRRLNFARRVAPLLRHGGRPALSAWVKWRIRDAARGTKGFYVRLPWVEAVCGPLPVRVLPTSQFQTILADWVDCAGVMYNTIDYFLGAGDWTPIIRSTDGDPVRDEAQQLADQNLVYSRTAIYQALVRAALDGKPQRRQGRYLRTAGDVDAYFDRFVKLFCSIESHGMLPSSTLDGAGVRFNQDRGLGVAVAPDGSLHRLQGANHRWAIAQVLGLKEVPVELRLHHVRSGPLLPR